MTDLLDDYDAYLRRIPEGRSCSNCVYWKLEPYKRHTGVCLHRWIPDAMFKGDAEGGWIGYGAYGRTCPQDWCKGWEAAR